MPTKSANHILDNNGSTKRASLRQEEIHSSHCSPSRYCEHQRTKSCMTSQEIINILDANGVATNELSSKTMLVQKLKKTAEEKAGGSESTLVASSLARVRNPIMRAQIAGAFRPMAPESWIENKNMWLSSHDIYQAMKQYERSSPDFMFIGVTPLDFSSRPIELGGQCVCPEMCALDLTKLIRQNKIKHCGVVFNLDKHDSRGSHWVSMYVGLDPTALNYGVFYYDSVGVPPKKEIIDWMHHVERTILQIKNMSDRPFIKTYNTIRRQFGHTECGIFAMVFLIHCLQKQTTFDDVCLALKGDTTMTSLRDVLFRLPTHVAQSHRIGESMTAGGKPQVKRRASTHPGVKRK